MQTLNVRFTGSSGTILHNGQLADPMNPYAKEIKKISGKRNKTDEDHVEIARIEFFGSFYLDENHGPCWPGENIERMLVDAAKKSKQGPKAKMSLFVDGVCPIIYRGPKTREELWLLEEFRIVASVRVQQSRVMRTRPIFRQWELVVPIQYDPTLIDESDVLRWCEVAGQQIGLSEWRPRYGRFSVAKA